MMNNKKFLSTILGIAIVATIGFGFNPMQKITSVHADTAQINPMPNEQWFSLNGITLKPGEFLDLVDTTPFMTTKGHVAAYLPCDRQGHTKIAYLQGVVDVGVNTLAPVDEEYLSQLSTPGKNCLYHFDIGTPDGVTDFAIINTGTTTIHFGDRNTLTFSSTAGFTNTG